MVPVASGWHWSGVQQRPDEQSPPCAMQAPPSFGGEASASLGGEPSASFGGAASSGGGIPASGGGFNASSAQNGRWQSSVSSWNGTRNAGKLGSPEPSLAVSIAAIQSCCFS